MPWGQQRQNTVEPPLVISVCQGPPVRHRTLSMATQWAAGEAGWEHKHDVQKEPSAIG